MYLPNVLILLALASWLQKPNPLGVPKGSGVGGEESYLHQQAGFCQTFWEFPKGQGTILLMSASWLQKPNPLGPPKRPGMGGEEPYLCQQAGFCQTFWDFPKGQGTILLAPASWLQKPNPLGLPKGPGVGGEEPYLRWQAGFCQTFWDFPKGQEWRGNEKKHDLLTNKLVLYTPLEKPKGPGLEQDAKNTSNMQENMSDALGP